MAAAHPFGAFVRYRIKRIGCVRRIKVRVQPEKCVFATDTVEYLGHICTPFGIRPDPKKIKAIEEYRVPKTIKEIRAFIGLAGYYRRHVRNFAELVKPLTNLTKKDVPHDWTGEHQSAFE